MPDMQNHLKRTNQRMSVVNKYMETYFSSNAAAQYPEKRVQLSLDRYKLM